MGTEKVSLGVGEKKKKKTEARGPLSQYLEHNPVRNIIYCH